MDQHFHRPLTIKPPALWELVREGKKDWARPQKHQKWNKSSMKNLSKFQIS